MPGRILPWVKAHQTETWLGAGGVAVVALALWRKHKANAAAAAPVPGMTIGACTPSATQLNPGSDGTTSDGGAIQDQINQSLGGIESQIAALQTAPPATTTTSDPLAQAIGSLTQAISAGNLAGLAPAAAAPRPTPAATLFEAAAGGPHAATLQQIADRYRMSTTEIQRLNPGVSLTTPLASGVKIQVNKPYAAIAGLPPEHIK